MSAPAKRRRDRAGACETLFLQNSCLESQENEGAARTAIQMAKTSRALDKLDVAQQHASALAQEMPALQRDFITVSIQAQIHQLQKFLAIKLGVPDWAATR